MHRLAVFTLRELLVDELRTPDRIAEAGPELRLQGRDAVKASALAGVDAVAGVPPRQPLVSPPDRFATRSRGERQGQPGDGAVGHRGVYPAALASSLDRHQRSKDGHRRLQAATADVRHLD